MFQTNHVYCFYPNISVSVQPQLTSRLCFNVQLSGDVSCLPNAYKIIIVKYYQTFTDLCQKPIYEKWFLIKCSANAKPEYWLILIRTYPAYRSILINAYPVYRSILIGTYPTYRSILIKVYPVYRSSLITAKK